MPIRMPLVAVALGTLLCQGIIANGELQAAKDASGSRLTIAWEAPARSLDPRFASDANSQYLESLINCALMSFDVLGRPIPQLAAAAPQWTSSTTLEIKLRPDARFADGSKVSVDDVKATYEFFAVGNPLAAKSARSGAFAQIKAITKKGTDTLVFSLTEADASFVSNLVVGILPQELARGPELDRAEKHRGCGPFVLKSVDTASILLQQNPHFSPAPKLAEIEFKIVKDEKTRFAKLQKGEVDLVQNLLSRDVLKDVERRFPQLKVQKQAALKTSYLGFNMRDKLTGNPAVRAAVALSIDRQEIIDYILGGLATPARTMLIPSDPFFNQALPVPTKDLEKAKAILDQAGFKAVGKQPRFKLSLKTTTDVTRISVARAIASQLKKVGIEVVVETMEWGLFAADVEAGRMQMWTMSWVGFKDPDIYRHAFATAAQPPHGGNRGWYSNAKLDTLLASGRSTTDSVQRKAIYTEVQSIIATDMPYIFLWHEDNFAVYNRALQGFELYADGRYSALTKAQK